MEEFKSLLLHHYPDFPQTYLGNIFSTLVTGQSACSAGNLFLLVLLERAMKRVDFEMCRKLGFFV